MSSSFDAWKDSLPDLKDRFSKEACDAVVASLKKVLSENSSRQIPTLQKCLVELYNRLKTMASKPRPEYPSSSEERTVAKCYIRCCTNLLTAVQPLARQLKSPESSQGEHRHTYKVVMAVLATFPLLLKAFPSPSFKVAIEPAAYEHVHFFCKLTGGASGSGQSGSEAGSSSSSGQNVNVLQEADWKNVIKVIVSATFDFVKLSPTEQTYEGVIKWSEVIKMLTAEWKQIGKSLPENVLGVIPYCWLKAVRHNPTLLKSAVEGLQVCFASDQKKCESFTADLIKHLADSRGIAARYGGDAINKNIREGVLKICVEAMKSNRNSVRVLLEILDMSAGPSVPFVDWRDAWAVVDHNNSFRKLVSGLARAAPLLEAQVATQMVFPCVLFDLKLTGADAIVPDDDIKHINTLSDNLTRVMRKVSESLSNKPQESFTAVLARAVLMVKLWNSRRIEDFFRALCDVQQSSQQAEGEVSSELYCATGRFICVLCHYFCVILWAARDHQGPDTGSDGKLRMQLQLAALSTLRLIVSKGLFDQFASCADTMAHLGNISFGDRSLVGWLVRYMLEPQNQEVLAEHDILSIILQTWQVGVSRYEDSKILQTMVTDSFQPIAEFIAVAHKKPNVQRNKAVPECTACLKLLDVVVQKWKSDVFNATSLQNFFQAAASRLFCMAPESDACDGVFPQRVGKISLAVRCIAIDQQIPKDDLPSLTSNCWTYLVKQMSTAQREHTGVYFSRKVIDGANAAPVLICRHMSAPLREFTSDNVQHEFSDFVLRHEQAELLALLDNIVDNNAPTLMNSPLDYKYLLATMHFTDCFDLAVEGGYKDLPYKSKLDGYDEYSESMPQYDWRGGKHSASSLWLNSWEVACRLPTPEGATAKRKSDTELLKFMFSYCSKNGVGCKDMRFLLIARAWQVFCNYKFHDPDSVLQDFGEDSMPVIRPGKYSISHANQFAKLVVAMHGSRYPFFPYEAVKFLKDLREHANTHGFGDDLDVEKPLAILKRRTAVPNILGLAYASFAQLYDQYVSIAPWFRSGYQESHALIRRAHCADASTMDKIVLSCQLIMLMADNARGNADDLLKSRWLDVAKENLQLLDTSTREGSEMFAWYLIAEVEEKTC